MENYVWSREQAEKWVSERPKRFVDWGIRAGEPEGRDVVRGLGGFLWAIQYCAVYDPNVDPDTMIEVRALVVSAPSESIDEEEVFYQNYKCYTCNDFVSPTDIVNHLIRHAEKWQHILYRDLTGWVWRYNPRLLRSVKEYLR